MAPHEQCQNDTVLQSVIDDLVGSVQAQEGAILLADEEESSLVFCVTSHTVELVGMRQPLDRGIVSLVFSLQEPMVVEDVKSDARHDDAVDRRVGSVTENMLVMVVSDKTHRYGVMTAINSGKDAGFEPQDLAAYERYSEVVVRRLQELDRQEEGKE